MTKSICYCDLCGRQIESISDKATVNIQYTWNVDKSGRYGLDLCTRCWSRYRDLLDSLLKKVKKELST